MKALALLGLAAASQASAAPTYLMCDMENMYPTHNAIIVDEETKTVSVRIVESGVNYRVPAFFDPETIFWRSAALHGEIDRKTLRYAYWHYYNLDTTEKTFGTCRKVETPSEAN